MSDNKLSKLGLKVPTVLLPAKNVDISKWAVIACDQFTSEKDYWEKAEKIVGDSPSTLNIIFPEVYLEELDHNKKNKAINTLMESYLNDGVLEEQKPGFVYIQRKTPFANERKGLVVGLDLEQYSFEKGAKSLVRPTEATILDRLPPRAAVRENAVLDLPHILVLFDDPENKLFNKIDESKKDFTQLYKTDLMLDGGSITGSLIEDDTIIDNLADIFKTLISDDNMLFAMGDGNHSLASAKQVWEKRKAEGADMNHPSRYALVELENIHDSGLLFHPIHRVLFKADSQKFITDIKKQSGFTIEEIATEKEAMEIVEKQDSIKRTVILLNNQWYLITMEGSDDKLAAELLHSFLDPWLDNNSNVVCDYIHGEDVVIELAEKGNIGIVLPPVNKSTFFNLVEIKGALPRKTFSIGESVEKRYYLEASKLLP